MEKFVHITNLIKLAKKNKMKIEYKKTSSIWEAEKYDNNSLNIIIFK